MKRNMFILTVLPLLVLAFSGVSHAWQGRMGGMGDPYGLISDESDFLIHPAKIAKGEGVRLYGSYRFTYTGMDWDIDFNLSSGTWPMYHDLSGDEQGHDVLVGAALPLGPGRMGLFFSYAGRWGDYEGDHVDFFEADYLISDVRSDLNNFALRLLYGLPLGSFNLGGEVQFSYRREEHESFISEPTLEDGFLNSWGAYDDEFYAVLPSFTPYDSRYWEALLKGSLEGTIGPADIEFTLQGGFIFGGESGLNIEESDFGVVTFAGDMDGAVNGWRIGGDLWVRYPLDDLVLPLLVRVDYQEKSREGDGPFWSGYYGNYETTKRNLHIEVGGGVDKEFNKGTRIAAGISYNYLQDTNDFCWGYFLVADPTEFFCFDHGDWPDYREHQVMLRLAGEHELSPAVALRMGLNGFFGWATEDQTIEYTEVAYWHLYNYSLDGPHWGIGASLGATIRFQQFALESFVNGGYQSWDLSDEGVLYQSLVLVPPRALERDDTRRSWYIGGGLSVLFNL